MRHVIDSLYVTITTVLLLSLLSGCASTKKIVTDISDTIKNQNFLNKNISQLSILDESAVPADIRLSVTALVLKMRHKKFPGKLVRFAGEGAHFVREAHFNYAGFKWNSMIITRYDVAVKDGRNSDIVLEGALYFSDNVGRFTSSTFKMDYRVEKNNRITILDSSIADNFSLHPIVKTYFVPLKDMAKKRDKFKSFNALYDFARKHSVRIRANEKELSVYQQLSLVAKMKGQVPDKTVKGNFVAMVFCLERFPDHAHLLLDVTDNVGKSLIADNNSTTYLDYSGWEVGIVGLKGKIRSSKNPIQIKVYERKNRRKRKIGLFKSSFYYENEGDFSGAPLTKKNILLNPNIRENAKLIQARLYALGYYTGAIDGLFGKNSKQSLQQFKKDHQVIDSSIWDLATQKLLFENTGL